MKKHGGPPRNDAESSYPTPKVRGGDLERQAAMVQEQPKEAIPCPRSGATAKRSYPTSKEWQLCRYRRVGRSYSIFKVRRNDHVQGNMQRQHFAGAAVKR